MKVPLVWVKKQPKLEPTTHCQPGPYILSNSCSDQREGGNAKVRADDGKRGHLSLSIWEDEGGGAAGKGPRRRDRREPF